ncbi:NAD(P)H-dependent oxidoreductase [Xenorhabdus szentirmaii]|uniref:Modulator of drug activity B n=2 Tax=Xenorhabdus szentirmaii TaxID=290112 RepID=W1IUJ6_9GAMM|nr:MULTISPECIES: NAD(P)H-dependent oxidoreductase [Xenorhabdus]MBD2801031.1 NAD(P)H-dependent oxidoreductase [Xenorhabdus sp. M]MBD2806189.1 NAD(P)H-dependent oxidoreductase [Xenorhabdus sp. ZM]MBD2822375.1 NAD(P)H-dependent oxidoreductase [Xenorhabdus sp. 42]PHM32771.1 NADPH quinone reductase MdaB [Xenorhabdus szentirmaii DSM 16338]PHM40915.1 NADPH quinone reductase MdaB [Xenorhabdus szentirmaii]
MSRILVINSAKNFKESKGELNNLLANVIKDHLTGLKHEIQVTHVDKGYDIQAEIDKLLWANSIIYQMPGWWMGPPWILKKYIDEVFQIGQGKLYKNDGRTRNDPNKKYGSGGLLHDKTYMLSVTWNAPLEAFEDPNQFFEGKGVDGLYFHFHKANKFLGMSPLPIFNCYDVIKNPQIESDIEKLKIHLSNLF